MLVLPPAAIYEFESEPGHQQAVAPTTQAGNRRATGLPGQTDPSHSQSRTVSYNSTSVGLVFYFCVVPILPISPQFD